jgi:hypothetical protein
MATLGLIFGLFGLFCCSPIGIADIFTQASSANVFGVTVEIPEKGTGEKILLLLAYSLLVPAHLLLVAGSIGTFMTKPWTRLCMLTYAALYILGNILHGIGSLPSSMKASSSMFASQAELEGFRTAGSFLGVFCSILFTSLYAFAVLIVYNLKGVKATLRGEYNAPPPGGGGWYGQTQPPAYPGYPGYPPTSSYPPTGGYPPGQAYPGYPPAYPGSYPQPEPSQSPNHPPAYPPYPDEEGDRPKQP